MQALYDGSVEESSRSVQVAVLQRKKSYHEGNTYSH